MDGAALASIVVAGIAAIASVVSARIAGQNKKQVKTSNGHTIGQIVETIDKRLERVEDQQSKLNDAFTQHLLDWEIHQPPDDPSRIRLWNQD